MSTIRALGATVALVVVALVLAQLELRDVRWRAALAFAELERQQTRVARGAAIAGADSVVLQDLRDQLRRVPGTAELDVRDGIVTMHSSAEQQHAQLPAQLRNVLQGQCRGVSTLVVSVGAPVHVDLVAASLGCSVAAFSPDARTWRARAVSAALNACGSRVVDHRVVAWNESTASDGRLAVRACGAGHCIVRAESTAPAGVWQSPPLASVPLAVAVRQNVQLLIVASADWVPVLQGLAGFAFRVRSAMLVAPRVSAEHQDAAWAVLERFMVAHRLRALDVATRARVGDAAALRLAGGSIVVLQLRSGAVVAQGNE